MTKGCDGGPPSTVQSIMQIWSSGDAGADIFFPGTPAMKTIDWIGGRASLEVQATSGTGEIEVSLYYQLSNDQITWDSPVAMSTDTGLVSALGYDYGTAGTTVPTTKKFVRFGLVSNQKAGTAIEQMRVRFILDRNPR